MKTYTCDEIAQKENSWAGQNFSRYCSEEYDNLWQQAQQELDPQKRQQLFIQMNDKLVKEDTVVMPIVHRADVIAISNNLKGVELTPWDRNTWNIMEWDKQ
jgi:peptide/nickel transport system substrate-binding protein